LTFTDKPKENTSCKDLSRWGDIFVKSVRFGARASVLALATTLAACGGGSGGVGSTPTPTPAPTPTPTPTPAASNDDLIAPLVSESFANDAVTGNSSYPTSGANGTSNAVRGTLSVAYDASNQSYTITVASRSKTFAPSQMDVSLSNSQISVYKAVNGNVTDTLTLTKPGTSGSLTYQYVGSGFWQGTTQGSNTISGSLDAFTYGIITPAASVPRTGNASYAIDLLGTVSYADTPASLRGTGTLLAKFGTGEFVFNGNAQEVLPTGQVNGTLSFSSTGTIASSGNSFAGNFDLSGFAAPTSSLNGRFYGPNASELGASWSIMSTNIAAVGTIMGRATTAGALLTTPASFALTLPAEISSYDTDAAGNQISQHYSDGRFGLNNFAIAGSLGNNSYTVSNGVIASTTFQSSDLSAADSDASWLVYRRTVNGAPSELRLFQTGSSNPKIALTYTSFGRWNDRQAGSTPSTYIQVQRVFTFGQKTDLAFRPTSGTATYSGVMMGVAHNLSGTPYKNYTLDGTFDLAFNFTANTMSGIARTSITDVTGGSPIALPNLSLTGNLHPASVDFIGNIGVGGFKGSFFGPNSEEIGATFQTSLQNPASANEFVQIAGAMAGKR
jgi:hypothetical protein